MKQTNIEAENFNHVENYLIREQSIVELCYLLDDAIKLSHIKNKHSFLGIQLLNKDGQNAKVIAFPIR